MVSQFQQLGGNSSAPTNPQFGEPQPMTDCLSDKEVLRGHLTAPFWGARKKAKLRVVHLS